MSTLTTSTISISAFLEIAKRQARSLTSAANYENSLNILYATETAFDTLSRLVQETMNAANYDDRKELCKAWEKEKTAFRHAYEEAFKRCAANI